jgi:hypothetical protein
MASSGGRSIVLDSIQVSTLWLAEGGRPGATLPPWPARRSRLPTTTRNGSSTERGLVVIRPE